MSEIQPTETWLPVGDHPMYEVSDHGNVRSLYTSWRGRRVLRPATRKHGYKMVVLHNPDGPHKGRYIHRLVAESFLPNPQGLPVVHHKDANPGNNHVSNLEWTTQKENIRQAMLVRGNWLKEACKTNSERTRCSVAAICPKGTRQTFASLRDAADYLDGLAVAKGAFARPPSIYVPNISKASRTGKSAYGFYWERPEATPI